MDDSGVINLANGIVRQAAEDYAAEYRKYLHKVRKRGQDSVEAKNQLGYVIAMESWFDSPWYHLLTGVGGRYLVERIRKEVKKGWY